SAMLAGPGIALNKTTEGTVTLSGANTYTGPTTVTAGTLLVSGSLSISSSMATVSNTGSTLGGTGTVRDVTIGSGAILQGGVGTVASGTLTSGGAISFLDGAIIRLTLGADGTHSSLTRTGGKWVFDNDQAFDFTIISGASNTTYNDVISGLSGSETGLDSIGSWLITTAGVTGAFSYDGEGGVDLTVSVIPEPGIIALLPAGLLLLGLRRFRSARTKPRSLAPA
ncbi:MAG: autotransporter-associated beta strand repeat-containing protein, partial [Verrucomicrobiota bacterium]